MRERRGKGGGTVKGIVGYMYIYSLTVVFISS